VSASSTDVRAWLREQGEPVPARGAIPQVLREKYEQAHPAGTVIPGELIPEDYSMGVTEADFPPDDTVDEPAAAPAKGRERKPRTVKAPAAKGIRQRIFGGTGAKPKHAKGPRVSLSDWAEETWSDLAWLTSPVPPLAKILTIQAPYAGAVFDDQVKGTVIDSALQPIAKYSGAFRALNGLAGPPVYVGLICAVGQRVQLHGPDGVPLVDELGNPVTDYDGRTQMLFQGLRYSLLQMTKIAELNAEQIRERTQASADRMAAVEAMIEAIFGVPSPQFSPPPQAAPGGGGEPSRANGYRYPDAPVMDGTGADPGRI
jgi:hypothetical protein